MKKWFLILAINFSALQINAQIGLTAAMGINYFNAPSMRDYINFTQINQDEQLSTFGSNVDFLLEADYELKSNFQFGIEYVLSIYSFNAASRSGANIYKISYNFHKPSFLAYYLLSGEGYKFKFGGGLGLRITKLEEQLSNNPSAVNYNAIGFGIVLKAQGYTLLSGNLYANIGVDLRYDISGEPKDNNDNFLVDNTINENINLNAISFGIHLGVAYFFEL